MHELNLMDKYYNLIDYDLKTKEGRIYKNKFRNIQVNDFITFSNSDNKDKNKIICVVTKIDIYENFHDMLKEEGLKNFLPGIKSIKKGVEIYYSIPNYEKEEKIYGVVSFSFKKITDNNN